MDMKQRFIGHRNDYEDHSDVGFLGQQGEYVISGSADGLVYIWEKISGRLVRTLRRDKSKLGKCLHSHPFDSAVALYFHEKNVDRESHGVELWKPRSDDSDEGLDTDDDAEFKAMEENQKIMKKDEI